MNTKKVSITVILILLSFVMSGCGKVVSEENGMDAEDVSGGTEAVEESEEPVPHEHSFIYTSDSDGSHSIICGDELCDYSDAEACDYDEEYQCRKCEYKHAHEIEIAVGNDGTHLLSCRNCDYSESIICTLNEEFICAECGWTHEHEGVFMSNADSTHAVNCKYECCDYSYQEDCVYAHYECQSCGQAYPWEHDIKYFDETSMSKETYYAQKELNIYKYPDLESEIVGTLGVNEEVYCVGSVLGKEYKNLAFWITEDGRCIPNEYHFDSNRFDLRKVTTDQVVVKYMTLSGDTWSPLKMHGVYESYDAALQDLCGSTWTHIKANWQYNDYKSQGLPFMNSYSEGASGKTVATRNGVDPYNYSSGGSISYYFE